MKALVVEDEALIRLNLCDMLEELGFETAQTASWRARQTSGGNSSKP